MLKLPGAFHHNEYRYLHLLIPFALLGTIELLRPRADARERIGMGVALVMVLIAAGGVQGAWARYEAGIDKTRFDLQDVSSWAAQNLPADAIVMVHDAGVISRFGDHKLIDIVGLKSRSSAQIHQSTTFAECKRDPRAMHRIASNSGATHFIVLTAWDEIFELTDGLRNSGWHLTRTDAARGEAVYQIYTLKPPPA